jgi:hypothetical protein
VFDEKKGCQICDKCKKEVAKYNEQLVWVLWKYNPKTDKYSKKIISMAESIESNHLCEKCKEEEWW